MGLWDSGATDERYVELWVPVFLKKGWPEVKAAIARGSKTPSEKLTLEQVVVSTAGAIIVGAALGHREADIPPNVRRWVKANRSKLKPALIPPALRAVNRAIAFWADIWGEGDETFGYQTAAVALCKALGEPEDDPGRDAPES